MCISPFQVVEYNFAVCLAAFEPVPAFPIEFFRQFSVILQIAINISHVLEFVAIAEIQDFDHCIRPAGTTEILERSAGHALVAEDVLDGGIERT